MDLEKEIEMLYKVRENAYVPYSDFRVGAVLKAKSGNLYTGCNIENHGIQAICAERVAFTKALSEGEKEFEYIVVAGGKGKDIPKEECLPCGYCRQFMSEFVGKEFKIYAVFENSINEYKIEDLLPYSFKFEK